ARAGPRGPERSGSARPPAPRDGARAGAADAGPGGSTPPAGRSASTDRPLARGSPRPRGLARARRIRRRARRAAAARDVSRSEGSGAAEREQDRSLIVLRPVDRVRDVETDEAGARGP